MFEHEVHLINCLLIVKLKTEFWTSIHQANHYICQLIAYKHLKINTLQYKN